MASRASGRDDEGPLYPPTVTPPAAPLSLPRYFLNFVRNPLRVMPEIVYREPLCRYGDRLTWVTDPALVKRILLDDRDTFPKTPVEQRVLGPLLGKGILIADGPDWRWQRQTAAPLFRHADTLRYAPAMIGAADALVEQWRSDAAGTIRRVDEDMTRATFRVIAETMLAGDDAAIQDAMERANQAYVRPMLWPIAYAVLGLPAWLPYPGRQGRRRATRIMRAAAAELVETRRAGPPPRDDLLSHLVLAKDPDTGQPMSDEQLVDNLLTFLLAGHETTAKALTWALYLVARSPVWEERLHDEIATVAGSGPIAPMHIERLTQVTKFLKESMRLYPPISSLVRIAAKDTDLDGTPIRAGSLIVIPIFVIHRHKRLWEDPGRFDPERFSPENESRQVRYQFMPFGAGPRVCIGASFSMVEGIAMLATFVRAARFEVPTGHVPTPLSRVTLQPSRGMPLKVWPRERWAGS